MYKWKPVVEVEQVLVISAVAHYCRGKLLPAVDRVKQCERKAAVIYILFDVVDVVKFKDACEEVQQTYKQRCVLICEQTGGTASRDTIRCGHHRVQTDYGVAFRFILLGEARNILRRLIAVALRSAPNGGDVRTLFLAHFSARHQLIEPVGVRYVVEVVVLLPLLISVQRPLVVAELDVLLVLCKDERVVQP